MIYVKYIAVLAFGVLAITYLLWYLRRIRRDHFQKLSIEKLLAHKEDSRAKLYLNTQALRQIISILLAKENKKNRRALLNLACGRISAFKNFLDKNSKLKTLGNILFPEKIEELPPADKAVWFLSQNQIKEAEKIIENLADKGLSQYAKARKRFVQGWIFLRDGDMLSASQCAAEAATLFAEQKAFGELAKYQEVEVMVFASRDKATTITTKNGLESSESKRTSNSRITIRAGAYFNDMLTIGQWYSKNEKLFYLAKGCIIQNEGKK